MKWKILTPKLTNEKNEIDLDDAYYLLLIYENNIDPNLVREHYPTNFSIMGNGCILITSKP